MWNGIGIGIGRTSFPGFSGLLNEFGGAAAAYSLRKLSSDATNAVQVRRESDNATLDIGFKSGELDTATLETFVNCEDVAPADYGSGAAAAYSLRYVSASYTGDVIQVRRSSDDTTQDFNPTEITDGTLATFCGAGDGFVTTWYDQSGNGYDAEQTTAASQPQIVSSGSVILENGKPALQFDGSNDTFSTLYQTSGDLSIFYISKITNNTQDRAVVSSFIDLNNRHFLFWYDVGDNLYRNDVFDTINSNRLDVSSYDSNQNLISHIATSTSQKFIKNSTVSTSTYTFGSLGVGTSYLNIGSQNASDKFFAGTIQEITLYPSDQSSNRRNIETNINSYYGIYTSDANGYVTTWYDQSGSDNHAIQTNAFNQPQIVSSGSVILENGQPAIHFDGTSYQMQSNFATTLSQPNNFYMVSTNDSSGDVFIAIDGYTTGLRNTIFITNAISGNNKYAIDAGNYPNGGSSFIDDNNQKLVYTLFDDTSSSIAINNSTAESVSPGNQSIDGITIGARFNLTDHWWEGNIQEIILYPSDQSSNRTGISDNINAQYQIYWDGSQTSLLDSYSGSAAAYSLRALSSSYTGPLVEVRRASDNATQDIYAKYDGTLNVDALESFCSGTNGFVTTWYDQSGNGRDATQTTASNQPQIVSSGSVILQNGKPSTDWNGSMNLQANSVATIINGTDLPISSFTVYKQDRTNATEEIFAFGKNGAGISDYYVVRNNNSSQYRNLANDGSTTISLLGGTTNTNQILRADLKKSTTLDVFVDSSVVINNQSFDFGTFSGLDEFTIGNWEEPGFVTGFDGKMQEIIFYNSDQSSNRTGIETNINDFYSIYYVPSDSDAQAFVSRVETAGGSLSDTEKEAVDTLVSDLKDAGIWTKMKAIYPMVGASAAACAQNLKSSSFTGTFNGGWTFASTGVTPNGTNGYLDTQFVPSVEFGVGNGAISVYSRTSGSRSADFGRYTANTNAIIGYTNLNGSVYSWFGDTGYKTAIDSNNGLGFFNFQRTSSSNKNVFANATKVLNENTTFTGWPNLFMPIGAYFFNTNFSESSGREFAFAHLGDALTDTEATDFYTAVQAFQTTLSREV